MTEAAREGDVDSEGRRGGGRRSKGRDKIGKESESVT